MLLSNAHLCMRCLDGGGLVKMGIERTLVHSGAAALCELERAEASWVEQRRRAETGHALCACTIMHQTTAAALLGMWCHATRELQELSMHTSAQQQWHMHSCRPVWYSAPS